MFCQIYSLRTLYLPSFFFFSKLRSITREVHLLIWKRIVLFLKKNHIWTKLLLVQMMLISLLKMTMTGDGDDSLSRRRVRDCRLREPLSYIVPFWWIWWWWRWQWGLAMIELAEEGVDVQRAAASFYFPSPLPPPHFLHSDCTVQRVATKQFFHWTASSIEIAMFTVHSAHTPLSLNSVAVISVDMSRVEEASPYFLTSATLPICPFATPLTLVKEIWKA